MERLMRLRPKVKLHTDFYVFDTETGNIKDGKIKYELNARPESFLFGVIYGHNFTKVIYSVEDFQNELKDPRYKNKKVFAHNAEYDLNVLYGNIYDMDAEAIFNGRFIRATNGNCIFADSMNIYKASVKKIGAMLGLNKQKLGDDNLTSSLDGKKIPAKDINYCIRDCEIVYEALIRIFEDAGDIKITQASLSLTYFRRYHQPFNIDHNHNTSYFWNSYYGGRTEAFKLGDTHATVYDVNSMYPDRMKNTVFPNPKYLKKETCVKPKNFINRYLYNFEGCIHATVIHKDNWIGFLPVKYEGKLCFPTGVLTGWWNFNEIRFALERGVIEITQINTVVYGEPMESIFKGFVDTLYLKRYQTDNELEIFRIKIFMNSLYGKFAQRINTETIYLDNVEKHLDLIHEHQRKKTLIKLMPFNSERSDAFLVVKSKNNYSLKYSIPSFSSYITSAARLVLLEKLLEWENFKPVYCDTDSIFLEIDPKITTSKKLGDWGKENKIVTNISGLKNYSYIENSEEIRKIKGVPKYAKQIEKNTFEYYNLIKTKEALRRQIDPGVKIKRTKVLRNKYTKRIVLDNGETEPIKL